MLVDVLKAHGDLPGQFAGVRHAERARTPDQPSQVQPLDILHDQHRAAVDFAGIVGADDLRVVESADGLHLALEASDGPLVLDAALGQHLQGDDAVQLGVQGLVDRAHAAVPKFLQELVFAKLAGDGKRHRGPVVLVASAVMCSAGLPPTALARAKATPHSGSAKSGSSETGERSRATSESLASCSVASVVWQVEQASRCEASTSEASSESLPTA